MAGGGERAIELLESIDKSLKQLLARQSAGSAASGGAVAPDRDLDGKYGDPEVRMKDPRDWTGPVMKGRKFSECPPDYLDMIADRFDYFANKADEEGEKLENGKPASTYKRIDAARARGWAKRLRDGRHVQTQPPAASGLVDGWAAAPADDDIPF